MSCDSRRALKTHPDAILFLRIWQEGVFQQLQALSLIDSGWTGLAEKVASFIDLSRPTYSRWRDIFYSSLLLAKALPLRWRPTMRGETGERWRDLCKQAEAEQDHDSLLMLIREINGLLDEKEARLAAARSKRGDGAAQPKQPRKD